MAQKFLLYLWPIFAIFDFCEFYSPYFEPHTKILIFEDIKLQLLLSDSSDQDNSFNEVTTQNPLKTTRDTVCARWHR